MRDKSRMGAITIRLIRQHHNINQRPLVRVRHLSSDHLSFNHRGSRFCDDRKTRWRFSRSMPWANFWPSPTKGDLRTTNRWPRRWRRWGCRVSGARRNGFPNCWRFVFRGALQPSRDNCLTAATNMPSRHLLLRLRIIASLPAWNGFRQCPSDAPAQPLRHTPYSEDRR